MTALSERQQKEARQVAEKQAAEPQAFDLTIYAPAVSRPSTESSRSNRRPAQQQEQKRPGFQGIRDDLKNKGRPETGTEKARPSIERQQLDERQRQEQAQFVAGKTAVEKAGAGKSPRPPRTPAQRPRPRDRRGTGALHKRKRWRRSASPRRWKPTVSERARQHDELRDGPPPPLRGK